MINKLNKKIVLAYDKDVEMAEITQYALKGQKLLAQGTALGLLAVNKAPCKGKSFVYCLVLEGFCPYRAAGLHP